jgi:hypothetical protein
LNLNQLFTLAICIAHIDLNIKNGKKVAEGQKDLNRKKIIQMFVGESIISIYIFIYVCITMIFTTELLIFHIRMVLSNVTTKEELKKFFKNPFGNPYARSIGWNFKSIICPKKAKMSLIDLLIYNNKMYVHQQSYLRKGTRREESTDTIASEDNSQADENKKSRNNINNLNSKTKFKEKDQTISNIEINNEEKSNKSIKNDREAIEDIIDNKSKSNHSNHSIDLQSKNSKKTEVNESEKNVDIVENDKISRKSIKKISLNTMTDDYNVEDSNIYSPFSVNNYDLNNDVGAHIISHNDSSSKRFKLSKSNSNNLNEEKNESNNN